MNAGYILLCLTLLLGYVIWRRSAYNNNHTKRENQSFWDRESAANSVRKKDISNLDYISFNPDDLPIESANALGLNKLTEELYSFTERKIINLSQYSNTDLKMMYGPANLEFLSEYDNNFTTLIKLLNKISKELTNMNQSTLAKEFLEYSIKIGSDLSSDYELLGTIYHNDNNEEGFNMLIQQASGITSLSKDIITSKLNNIKSTTK